MQSRHHAPRLLCDRIDYMEGFPGRELCAGFGPLGRREAGEIVQADRGKGVGGRWHG